MIRAKISMMVAASAMALATVACSGSEPAASQAVPTAETAANGPMESTVDQKTTDFVQKATLANMYEIEASKLALDRSKVQSVKDFAQMMIDDHTPALTEVQSLATSAMVTPPTTLDNDLTSKMEALRNAKVEDFDDVYIDQQTEAHENTLNALKDYSTNGADAGLRAFAAKMIAPVDGHLTKVRALDKSSADDITKPSAS